MTAEERIIIKKFKKAADIFIVEDRELLKELAKY